MGAVNMKVNYSTLAKERATYQQKKPQNISITHVLPQVLVKDQYEPIPGGAQVGIFTLGSIRAFL